jgi:hypothetical protein
VKSRTLPLIEIISLILITLAFSLPAQGESLLGNLLELLGEAERNVAAYNIKIKQSEATVNAIIDDMDGVRPPGESRSPDERVKALKEGITGELAKAKTNQLALKIATEQLGVALDRYTKNPTPANFKNAQDIAKQINSYRDKLNGNFEIIRGLLIQLSKIRRNFDEKEWDKPDGKYKKEREALDNLWNSLKVVPNVVDMSFRRAIEALAEVGLTVDKLVTEPAPSEDLSEKVTRQEPKAGEFIPPGKTAKLWHYTRFGVVAPPVTPPSTGAQGFKPGDASLVDPRFASHEKLFENGRAIAGGHPGQGFPWQRHWAIKEFSTPEAARANLNESANGLSKSKTGKWKASYGEGDTRVHIAEDEVTHYFTILGYIKNDGSSNIYIHKIYRDKFTIYYQEATKTYNDNLKKNWPPIHENSQKLIDERFPPYTPPRMPPLDQLAGAGESDATNSPDSAAYWNAFMTAYFTKKSAEIKRTYEESLFESRGDQKVIKEAEDKYNTDKQKLSKDSQDLRNKAMKGDKTAQDTLKGFKPPRIYQNGLLFGGPK